MPSVVIVGAGGFGREVREVLGALSEFTNLKFAGFVSDWEPQLRSPRDGHGAGWLGSIDDAREQGLLENYVIAVGDPRVRMEIAQRIGAQGQAVNLIHPTAWIGSEVELGEGTVVCANASLTTNIQLGRHNHINLNSTVGHDVVTGDFVTVSPLVAISGSVALGRGVYLGTGATIIDGVTVGDFSVVGAGAVVTKSVASDLTVVGVPAKPIGLLPPSREESK